MSVSVIGGLVKRFRHSFSMYRSGSSLLLIQSLPRISSLMSELLSSINDIEQAKAVPGRVKAKIKRILRRIENIIVTNID